jgi:lysophospholipase L1-like esterase
VTLRRIAGRTAAVLALSLVSAAAAELTARSVWHWQYGLVTARILKSFQYLDRSSNVVRNRPGSWTFQKMREELSASGRHLGLDDLEHLAAEYRLQPDDVVLEINQHGFVGPPVREPRPRGLVRVMTIGDSVTFGPYYAPASYPRAMERELAAAGVPAEVINTAVQGYSLEKVLKRVDEFVQLEPDVIAIMIGWNRTLIRADPAKNEGLYRRLALYRFYYHLRSRTSEATQYPGDPRNFYDTHDPLMDRLRQTSFEWDLADWTELTGRIRRKLPNCRIVVLSLAGLFMDEIPPDTAALRLGYSVTFTHNLHAWSVLASVYNDRLQAFARQNQLDWVDVADWSRGAFEPRGAYYIDSVHPNSRGYEMMGRFIASELVRQKIIAARGPVVAG